MRERMLGSSAENGSSISTILGSTASARAIATRWRSPPESMEGYLLRVAGEANEAQQLGGARPAPLLVARAEPQFRAEQHVVERGAPGNEPRRLEHERDFRPGVAWSAPIDGDAPDVDVEQAADHPQQGGLSAAGRAQDANEFATPNVEAQTVINPFFAKRDADVLKRDDRVGRHTDQCRPFGTMTVLGYISPRVAGIVAQKQ